jgi:predicted RNA-binding Zn ribbon-like protein
MSDVSSATAAPGRLELVRRFVNTRDIEANRDALATTIGLETWLRGAGLLDADTQPPQPPVGAADRTHAVEVREALRALLLANHDNRPAPAEAVRVLNGAMRRAALSPSFSVATVARWTVEPATGGVDGALGRLLGVVIETMADGTWPRLKACMNDDCQWAFYDKSRARSGKWCSMGVCGNRAKQRAWRSRQAEAEAETAG